MVSGIGKRTGHSTLKNAKEKASLPQYPSPYTVQQQYRTTTQTLALQQVEKQLP